MTNIDLYKKDDKLIKIKMYDHANFANYGNDIVCSALSITILSVINSILEITKDKLIYEINEKENFIYCDFSKTKKSDLLISHLEVTLRNLKKDYKENINIKEVYND